MTKKERKIQKALGLAKVFEVSKTITVTTDIVVKCPVIATSEEEAIQKFENAKTATITEWGHNDVFLANEMNLKDIFDKTIIDQTKPFFYMFPGKAYIEDANEDISDFDDHPPKYVKHYIQ